MKKSCRCSFRILIVLTALLALVPTLRADVVPAGIFGSHMVLQRERPVPVWGRAEPNEAVRVTLAGQTKETTTDENGAWRVDLDALPAGGPHRMTIEGANTIAFDNILVGEVWICSGQSNMQWPVNRSNDAEAETAAADYPSIRLCTVPRKVSEEPLRELQTGWTPCSPQSVPGFSAVGYYFGRKLHKSLDLPIGLIHSSWGGTPAEAWTPHEALEAVEDLQPILERHARQIEAYPQAKQRYEEKLAEWEAKGKDSDRGRRPRPPYGPGHSHSPSGLYNAMIHPVIPYAIRGAIWYQGESNAGRAEQYRTLFPTMIAAWRQAWDQGSFPFLFVQLANFKKRVNQPVQEADWPELREAQLLTLDLTNTAMAVTIDVGEAGDIHPRNKQAVGSRLAAAALGTVYDRDVTPMGPIYDGMVVGGNRVTLTFRYTGGGLEARGDTLRGFAVAGKDRTFRAAEAAIEGNTVTVWSDAVPEPVAVRYGWADNPDGNLYNADGLPASPFRTDAWPGTTDGRR